MSEPLYTLDVLRLAASTAELTRLPDALSAERRSPICGSRVVIDLAMEGGRVTAAGGEVRACAFGQASAALFAQGVIGRSPSDIASARDSLKAYLAGQRDDPGGWQGLDLFERARAHPGRHAAILLPFDAAVAALAAMTV